ncbi:MAG: RecT family recombinase [Serratia sp. (in: enterobacteria)]|uniref:RecT family recombinase n=1 Tax=Serratia sp. (in: enterobacteria) TaxID=616 RepID=UPI003F3F6DE0
MENTSLPVENGASFATSISMIFNGQMLDQLTVFANLMADSTITIPTHLAGRPADCMAVIMQAMQWGMNPYSVAQKTYVVNGVLGYEAQLVNAVITSSDAIKGRFHYEYGGGDWSKCARTAEVIEKKMGKTGAYNVTKRVRAWNDADEEGLFIRVGAIIKGEHEITWGEPIHLSSVAIRNSPLWVTNPKQQMAYLAVKYWARLYASAVILGVYTPDELEQRVEREINPQNSSMRVSASKLASNPPVAKQEIKPSAANKEDKPSVDNSCIATDIRTAIETVSNLEQASAIRKQVEELKQKLGITDYTELKNKAVRRYRQFEKAMDINSKIEACKTPDDFAALEGLIQRSEPGRDLSADDLERFQIMLEDMRPEFVS